VFVLLFNHLHNSITFAAYKSYSAFLLNSYHYIIIIILFKIIDFSFLVDQPCQSQYTCPNKNCGKVYKTKGNLGRHLTYACGKEPVFHCQYCQKTCSLKSNLVRHVVHVHRIVPNKPDFVPRCLGKRT